MQEAEKNALVKAMANETDESTVSAYLGIAASKICRRAYPFDPSIMEVPEQYSYLQVEIATYLLNKRGGEGERCHNGDKYCPGVGRRRQHPRQFKPLAGDGEDEKKQPPRRRLRGVAGADPDRVAGEPADGSQGQDGRVHCHLPAQGHDAGGDQSQCAQRSQSLPRPERAASQ